MRSYIYREQSLDSENSCRKMVVDQIETEEIFTWTLLCKFTYFYNYRINRSKICER